MGKQDFADELRIHLKGAKKVAILAVGDELNPRDCVGIAVGKRIASLRLKNVHVFLTSRMPENFTSAVRKEEPSHVVLIDSAEMGVAPGEIAFIDSRKIVATSISTHAMPLSLLMDYFNTELNAETSLIGIQPATTEAYEHGRFPSQIEKAIDTIVENFLSILS